MACIKGASRSALAAFSPDSPYLAAGTMAGAVDLSFSSSANLEIFKLDFQSDDLELPVVGECSSTERFNRLSWGNKPGSPSDEFDLGLIAGGLIDGSIGVWNPRKLISSEGNKDDAFVERLERHTGPVRGLEFNISSPNLLASGADNGELCIWDLSNPKEPSLFPPLKSAGSGSQGEVSFLSWNRMVQHILASTSYNGTTVIWDLKRQKPVISFADSHRRRCSVLQWHPNNSTSLIVASDDDSHPALSFWDVRNTISPIKEFVGHTKGVLAMSWCPSDSSFLLTCAKDNRTICWDTISGEMVSELPASTNWNFDIHWYPKIPGVISASSFDGKIGIYNIEACTRLASKEGDLAGTLSSSGSFGVHSRAPKWLKCPVGVSFGFGGKLVSFHPNPSTANFEVYVHNVVTEHSLVGRSTEFEAVVQNGEKSSLRTLCEKKSLESESEDDRETWGFLKVMFEEEGTAKMKLLSHLGFSLPPTENDTTVQDELRQELDKGLSLAEETNEARPTDGTGGSPYPTDNGEDFFNNLQSPKADSSLSPSGDGFTAEGGAVPNGEQMHPDVRESSDSSIDEVIQRALVVGDYKQAVAQCISTDRMADALVIAHLGGSSLWEKTRTQYLKHSHSSYLKVVAAMVNNDLMSLVNTRPLNSWKETLALLCTFAQGEEWTLLCDSLALRLLNAGNMLAATLCFICAGNIDKTVEIWSRRLKSDHEGRTFVDLLQDLMEKTIVLALATGHKRFSTSLSKLVENYVELLASQGLLHTAVEYLKLLGTEESSHELAILRDRIQFSAEGQLLMDDHPTLFWTPCAAHCIDLMLHDICKLPIITKTVKRAIALNGYIYNHPYVLNMMRTFTEQKELIRLGVTRFATVFLTLQSIHNQKNKLRRMFTSEEWSTSRYHRDTKGKDAYEIVMSVGFWNNILYSLRATGPLVRVLRLVDSEKKPAMGYIYEAMDRAKEAISKSFNYNEAKYCEIWEIIDKRWNDQLHRPLHAAGYYLNPEYFYSTPWIESNEELNEGFLKTMARLVPDEAIQHRVETELSLYRYARGVMGSPNAIRNRALWSPEKEAPIYENSQSQTQPVYTTDQSQHVYQENTQSQQHQGIPSSTYGEVYTQPFSGTSYGGGEYQPVIPNQQFQEYNTPVPFQPTTSPHMFIPSQAPQITQANFTPAPVTSLPAAKPFVPSTPPVLKNYQQPTLGSQLFPGVSNPAYQPGPSLPGSLPAGPPYQVGSLPGQNLPQVAAPTHGPRGFMPASNPGFVQRPGPPGMTPVQPQGAIQPSPVQPVVAPPAPPSTVQTVDTSNVPAELKPVIMTLTNLFNETSEALGGSRANPARKREIEDNSKKIGSLFAKLNSGDISPNAAAKLGQLCQALDSGDFAGALHIQVLLTTSDWDECNFWLAALKRMIKTRQNVRLTQG